MNYIWIVLILANLVASHFVARYIGEKRKIGYGRSFLISFLMSFLVGLIITLASKKSESSE